MSSKRVDGIISENEKHHIRFMINVCSVTTQLCPLSMQSLRNQTDVYVVFLKLILKFRATF